MSDVTRLIDAAQAGDSEAAADLLPLVYDELRKLAATRMAAEALDHTLDATALVHEVYLRMVGPIGEQKFANRRHFLAAAAISMKRILVENARRKGRLKRGGSRQREAVDLDALAGGVAQANLDAVALGRRPMEEAMTPRIALSQATRQSPTNLIRNSIRLATPAAYSSGCKKYKETNATIARARKISEAMEHLS